MARKRTLNNYSLFVFYFFITIGLRWITKILDLRVRLTFINLFFLRSFWFSFCRISAREPTFYFLLYFYFCFHKQKNIIPWVFIYFPGECSPRVQVCSLRESFKASIRIKFSRKLEQESIKWTYKEEHLVSITHSPSLFLFTLYTAFSKG